MFKKFQKLIESKSEELILNQDFRILSDFFILIFGSEKNAKLKIEEIQNSCKTEEEIENEFKKLFNFDFFQEMYRTIPMSNLTDLYLLENISNADKKNLGLKITNPEMLNNYLSADNKIIKTSVKAYFDFDVNIENKELLANVIKYDVYFSKQDIANEFEIDKKTLNNWLTMLFGKDPYFKRKKISIYEYNDFYNKVFDLNENELATSRNQNDFIVNRILKGAIYSKTDIIDLSSSNSKTIIDNLTELNKSNYKKYDKFPYSIAKSILNDLGHDLEI